MIHDCTVLYWTLCTCMKNTTFLLLLMIPHSALSRETEEPVSNHAMNVNTVDAFALERICDPNQSWPTFIASYFHIQLALLTAPTFPRINRRNRSGDQSKLYIFIMYGECGNAQKSRQKSQILCFNSGSFDIINIVCSSHSFLYISI